MLLMYTLEGADEGSSTWVPAIIEGDLDGTLGSWLQPVAAPALVGTYTELAMEDLSSLSSILSFQIDINK